MAIALPPEKGRGRVLGGKEGVRNRCLGFFARVALGAEDRIQPELLPFAVTVERRLPRPRRFPTTAVVGRSLIAHRSSLPYSHSIVAGGLLLMS